MAGILGNAAPASLPGLVLNLSQREVLTQPGSPARQGRPPLDTSRCFDGLDALLDLQKRGSFGLVWKCRLLFGIMSPAHLCISLVNKRRCLLHRQKPPGQSHTCCWASLGQAPKMHRRAAELCRGRFSFFLEISFSSSLLWDLGEFLIFQGAAWCQTW